MINMNTADKIKQWKEKIKDDGYDMKIVIDLSSDWIDWFCVRMKDKYGATDEDIDKILSQIEMLLEEKHPINRISGKTDRLIKIENYIINNVI